MSHHAAAAQVFSAVSRVSVNHDGRGGTAPDPVVWDGGGRVKRREVDISVTVDLAALPPGPCVQVNRGLVTESDVAAWPFSVRDFALSF